MASEERKDRAEGDIQLISLHSLTPLMDSLCESLTVNLPGRNRMIWVRIATPSFSAGHAT
jgi:hypothetical protein